MTRGSCLPRTTLSSLSADGWSCFLSCWLFSLRLLSTGAFWLLDGVRCFQMTASQGAHTNDYPLGPPSPVTYPHSEPEPPSASPGDPLRPTLRFGPGSCFALGPGTSESSCAPSHSPMGFLHSMPDHQAGEFGTGFVTFSPVGEPLQYGYFPASGSLTQQV